VGGSSDARSRLELLLFSLDDREMTDGDLLLVSNNLGGFGDGQEPQFCLMASSNVGGGSAGIAF
jgi:hypothetical protein